MLESSCWIPAHRFLFAGLRQHLLGWPRSLVPDGRRAALVPLPRPPEPPHTPFAWTPPTPFAIRSRQKKILMNDKAEKTALFRYGLIAPLVLETLPRGELTRRAQEIAARLYDIPHSTRRHVSVDTLLEWTLRYRRNGLPALTPKPRQDRGQQRAIAPETAELIERLKRANPHRTGTALLRELAANEQT